MAQYTPGDKMYLPPLMFHGYGSAKSLIKSLDNFRTWFTMAEALGPLEDVDGDILLLYILSSHGFLAGMGVKFLISKLPSFAKAARRQLETCPAIASSLT